MTISRYYSNRIRPENVNPDTGKLEDGVFDELVKLGILPRTVRLSMSIFDVDHDASGCREVDHVYINGTLLLDSLGQPVELTSGDNTWSRRTYEVPTQLFKFPTAPGTSAANIIEIEIDVLCETSWAIEVDWIAVEIRAGEAARPFVFVHGWTGNENTFDVFTGYLDQDNIPYATPINYGDGVLTMNATALMLSGEILRTAREYGVDRVNIVAHSRGGLFVRQAMRTYPVVRDRVAQVVTLGSPHHGTRLSTRWLTWRNVNEMSFKYVRGFNYGENCKKDRLGQWNNCTAQYTEYLAYQPIAGRSRLGRFHVARGLE